MQQINFYQVQFKPKKVILPARQFLLIAFVAIAAFLVMSSYLHVDQLSKQANVDKKQSQIAKEEAQLIELRKQVEKLKEDPLLKAELTALQKAQIENKEILDFLQNEQLGNTTGFAENLVALSEQHIENLWLTQFSLLNAGHFIALNGQTTNAELVPEYIDSLAKAQPFKGKTFSVFHMQQPEQQGVFHFKLFTAQSSELTK